jgi:hypothetical protein
MPMNHINLNNTNLEESINENEEGSEDAEINKSE